jgi:hypothetical protein
MTALVASLGFVPMAIATGADARAVLPGGRSATSSRHKAAVRSRYLGCGTGQLDTVAKPYTLPPYGMMRRQEG